MNFNLISATPNGGAVQARLVESKVRIEFPAVAPFARSLRKRGDVLNEIWLGPSDEVLTPSFDPSLPFLNEIGDADIYAAGLQQAQALLRHYDEAAVLNHPDRVAGCRADLLYPLLAQIPGVRAPRAVRAQPHGRQGVLDVVKQHRLEWPLRLRTAQSPASRPDARIDQAEDIYAVDPLPLDGRDVLIVEDVALAGAQVRAVFVGGRMHVLSGDVEPQGPAASVLHDIDRLVGLDYVVINARTDGQCVVPLLISPGVDVFASGDPGAAAEAALIDLARDPKSWRGAPKEAVA